MAPTILICGLAAILLGDARLYARFGYGATITAWVTATPSRAGIAGVGIGLLIGHLFL